MAIKIYTKTKHHKSKQHTYIPRMYGVIEGPVNKMMKAYPDKFSFMKHKTMRDLRPSKGKK